MLLIDHNHTQVGKRREQRTAGTDHDGNISVSGPLELIIALAGGQPGIDHRHLVAEPAKKTKQCLVGQCNLRYKNDRLLASCLCISDDLHIHFRFSASCYSVQEISAVIRCVIPVPVSDHGVCGFLLLCVQRYMMVLALLQADRIAVNGRTAHLKNPRLLHGFYNGTCNIQFFTDQIPGKLRFVNQSLHQSFPGCLVLFRINTQLLLRILPGKKQPDGLFLAAFDFPPNRNHGFQRGNCCTAIPFLHPHGQTDQPCFLSQSVGHDGGNILQPVLFNVRPVPGSDAIPLNHAAALSEGHPDHHSRLQLISHFLRNPVLKDMIQLLTGNIDNDICVAVLHISFLHSPV